MALLGKISAVLTANTQDFSRQIGTARRELNQFAQQARGLQFNLDNRALNNTLTQLQRFQRTLREIQNLQRQGLGAGLPDPNRLRQQLRAFEDIGRPLTDVKNQIERLSNSLQSQLTPELSRVQGGFQRLYREIGAGTTTYAQAEQRIDNLRARLVALGRATAAVGDFGRLADALNANNSGGSFFQARARDSLQRSLDLRTRAQNVPAAFRSDNFADLAVAAEESAERVARAAARVARAQLDIATRERAGRTATPRQLNRRAVAQQRLDSEVSRQEAINNLFDRELTTARIGQIVSPEATRQVDALVERFETLSDSLRKNGNTRFDGLIASVGQVVEQLNQGVVSARRAKAAIDALAAADFSRAFGEAGFKDANKVLKTDLERTNEEIRRNFSAQRRNVIGGVGALRLIGPDRTRAIEEINTQENIALARASFNDGTLNRFTNLKDRAKKLDDAGITSELENIRRLSQDVNSALNAAFSAKTPQGASQALSNYRAKLDALNQTIDRFEKNIASAEAAQRRFSQFLTLSGSRSDKLGSSLTRFATDIAATRQLAGNLSANNQSGRAAIERRIESDLRFAEKVAKAQQKIADNERITERERSRRRRLVDDTVARRREESLENLVDNSGGRITRDRARSVMDRFARNQGSIGVSGAATAQLALQQGLFAIDDFVSATGGIEYKLRAVGNNITQLGLLLGQSGVIPGLKATTGLFIGLAVVLGGQVANALARFFNDSESLEQKIKSLNSALQGSENNAKQLADAYRSLADAIRDAGQSSIGKDNADLEKRIEDLSKLRRETATEKAAAFDPQVAELRARRDLLAKQRDESGNIAERVRLQRNIDRSKAEEDRILSRLSSQANGDAIARSLQESAAGTIRAAAAALNSANDPFRGVVTEEGTRAAQQQVQLTREAAARAAEIGAFDASDPAAAARALSAIRAQIDVLQNLRESAGVQGSAGIEADIDKIVETLLKDASRLQARLSGAFEQIDQRLTRSATFAARTLGQAQERISEAFGDEVSSSAIRAELDRLAEALADSRELASKAATPAEAAAFNADIEAINKHAQELLASANVVGTFSDALKRSAQSTEADAAAVRQSADNARMADLEFSTDKTSGIRTAADIAAKMADDFVMQIKDEIANALENAEADFPDLFGKQAKRIEEINRALAVPANEIGPDGTRGGTVGEREGMRSERARLTDQINTQMDRMGFFDKVRELQDANTKFRLNRESEDRGVGLGMSPADQAGSQLARDLRDIQAAFDNGLLDNWKQNQNEFAADQRRIVDDALRSTAPAIFGLADQVQNAVIQGPSRAALQVNDATTAQGAAELNRLLRGDDSARNQDFVELQKQSNSLAELVRIARENGAPPGVLEL